MTDKCELKFDAIKRRGMKSILSVLDNEKKVIIVDSKSEREINYSNAGRDFIEEKTYP